MNTELGWRGGERQLCLLAKGQLAQGLAPVVVAQPEGALAREAVAAGLEVVPLAMRGEWDAVAVLGLRRVLREYQPQVLHAHTPHALALGGVAALGLPVRRVAHRRVDFPLRHNPASYLKYHRLAQRIIAISQAVAEVLVQHGVPRDRVRVVPSAVPPLEPLSAEARRSVRLELGMPPDALVLGCVGALVDHKGQRFLIDALPVVLASYPQVHLLLLGEGPLEGALRAQALALGVAERVHFLGFRSDVQRVLGSLELLVVSSHLEGLCTSLLDAIWLEVPVVATWAGGIPEVLGAAYPLVAPRSGEALAQGVLRALTHPEAWARAGEGARQRARERFTVEKMVRGTLEVYQELWPDVT